MTAKKKPNPGASETNASAEAPPSNDNTLAPNDNEDHGEDFEVKDLADGDFEVDLHDLGISAEDIQVMKKIDARLSERLRQAQQAQAGTSNAPVATRAKGKGHELTTEELEEQLNKLKEEGLRCKAMRQSIRDRLVMMKHLRQDPKPVQQAPQPQRLRQQPILIEEQYSDEEEGEYVMPHQLRPQQGLATPLSAEFEELPCPPRFNPTILPQFDGDSDPKRFPPQVRSGHRSIRRRPGMQSQSIRPLAQGPRSALVLQPPRRPHPNMGPAPRRAHRHF